jgi:hypothetical protein
MTPAQSKRASPSTVRPFEESLKVAQAQGDRFDGEEFKAQVDADTRPADRAISRTRGGLSGLRLAAVTLGPALLTAGVVGAGALGGISAAAAPAIAGIVGFALVAKPALEEVTKAANGNKKALKDLDPALRPAVAQMRRTKKEFEGFQSALAPHLIPVFTGRSRSA